MIVFLLLRRIPGLVWTYKRLLGGFLAGLGLKVRKIIPISLIKENCSDGANQRKRTQKFSRLAQLAEILVFGV